MTGGKSLRTFDCVLMLMVAVLGLRWIASAAAGGTASISLWFLAMAIFFVPEGLAVAELSSRFPDTGGIYSWSKRALGDFHGFICGWCYWVNNLFYFPSLLLFVSANIAFIFNSFDPELRLDENRLFVTSLTLAILWLVALLNYLGMRKAKWLQNIGAVSNWVPVVVLIALGGLALYLYGTANRFSLSTLSPLPVNRDSIAFFAEMCFAFSGLELISMMIGEVHQPVRTISRALVIAGLAIAGIYVLGTTAVLIAVPSDQVTTVNGILLPIQQIAGGSGLGFLTLLCAALIAVGGCGGTMAWFAGASRVPYVVGVDRYLPRAFGRVHPTRGTPYVAILIQTGVATLFTLVAAAGAGTRVDVAYNVLVDMCLILYFIPFLYLFLALWILRRSKRSGEAGDRVFRIPGRHWSIPLLSTLGLTATTLAIIMSLLPPSDTDQGLYLLKTVGGSVLMILVGLGFYLRGRRQPARD